MSFNPEVLLVIDPTLAQRYAELSFNAGLRERSIMINTLDYLRIVAPQQFTVIQD